MHNSAAPATTPASANYRRGRVPHADNPASVRVGLQIAAAKMSWRLRPRSGLVVLFIAFGIASCEAKSDGKDGKEWSFADLEDDANVDETETCAENNNKW